MRGLLSLVSPPVKALKEQINVYVKVSKYAAVGTGVVVRRTADEAFEQRVEALTTTLKGQMELYEAEQRTLQVCYSRLHYHCQHHTTGLPS